MSDNDFTHEPNDLLLDFDPKNQHLTTAQSIVSQIRSGDLPHEVHIASVYDRKDYVTYDDMVGPFNTTYNDGETYHVAIIVEVSRWNAPDLFEDITALSKSEQQQKAQAALDEAVNNQSRALAELAEADASVNDARKRIAELDK